MKTTERWTIGVADELRVVGYNPENADLDHPNGEIVRLRYYLQATNARGDRRRYGLFETASEAEAAIPVAPAVVSEDWYDDRPEYGSRAYQEYGEEADMEAESRMNDAADMGFDTRYMSFF